MPASIKLQQELGDDLQVLFVESQGTSPEATEKFILEKKWFGNNAMWTNEHPFSTGSNGLPNFALLSNDGKVLFKGNHASSAVHDLIAEEIKRAKDGPAETPKKLQKAWKTFGKDQIAKAIDEAKKVGTDPELSSDAELCVIEFQNRVQARIDRAKWLIENGYASRGAAQIDALVKALKGCGELYDAAAAVQASLEGEELAKEVEASELLEKHLAKLYEDPKDDKLFKKVAKLAEDYAGTKAAERASHVASLGR